MEIGTLLLILAAGLSVPLLVLLGLLHVLLRDSPPLGRARVAALLVAAAGLLGSLLLLPELQGPRTALLDVLVVLAFPIVMTALPALLLVMAPGRPSLREFSRTLLALDALLAALGVFVIAVLGLLGTSDIDAFLADAAPPLLMGYMVVGGGAYAVLALKRLERDEAEPIEPVLQPTI